MKTKKLTAITFSLILTIAALMASMPTTSAAKISVVAVVSVQPKIVGLGESVSVNAFIIPMPQSWMEGYKEIYVVFTKPDGTTVTKGPFTAYREGTLFFLYQPDKLGQWSVKMTWAGDEVHEGAESELFKFTVQEEGLPPIPPAELPTDDWERPISAENREWAQISGDWYYSGKVQNYNASGGGYNPYSKAPETAHILWTHQPLIGGLVGGEFGGDFYSALYYPSVFTVIMGGRVYFTSNDGLHCLDERTGEELWQPPVPVPGTSPGGTSMTYAAGLWGDPGPTTYTNRDTPQSMTCPSIWTTTSTAITKYCASTGAVLMILTPPTNQTFGATFFDVHEDCAYTQMSVVYPDGTKGSRLVKWDTIGTIRDFSDKPGGLSPTGRIIWDEPAPAEWYWWMGLWGDALVTVNAWGASPAGATAVSALTGELLWTKTLDDYIFSCGGILAYGKLFYLDSPNMRTRAFDLTTGLEVWASELQEYPWGGFTAYNMGAAYGKVYVQCYDGHIYAYDTETGKTAWKFYSGDTSETPYGTWPFWSGIAIADGKVYAGTSEHSPTAPFVRGCRLYCFDANTGDELWSIAFANGGGKSIADGTLIASNEYDSTMYAFNKGPTAVTVTASPKVSVKSSSVLIEGTVTDQSPAQKDTPAISDNSMTEWMEYLHMQKPIPADATGVEVTLDAIDPNGNFISIDRVTSDISGLYSCMWTPEIEGKYTIIATFEGSESYWASYAETAIGVDPAPSPAVPIEPEPSAPLISTEGAIIAAVAVAAVIGIAAYWILRKRK